MARPLLRPHSSYFFFFFFASRQHARSASGSATPFIRHPNRRDFGRNLLTTAVLPLRCGFERSPRTFTTSPTSKCRSASRSSFGSYVRTRLDGSTVNLKYAE